MPAHPPPLRASGCLSGYAGTIVYTRRGASLLFRGDTYDKGGIEIGRKVTGAVGVAATDTVDEGVAEGEGKTRSDRNAWSSVHPSCLSCFDSTASELCTFFVNSCHAILAGYHLDRRMWDSGVL